MRKAKTKQRGRRERLIKPSGKGEKVRREKREKKERKKKKDDVI